MGWTIGQIESILSDTTNISTLLPSVGRPSALRNGWLARVSDNILILELFWKAILRKDACCCGSRTDVHGTALRALGSRSLHVRCGGVPVWPVAGLWIRTCGAVWVARAAKGRTISHFGTIHMLYNASLMGNLNLEIDRRSRLGRAQPCHPMKCFPSDLARTSLGAYLMRYFGLWSRRDLHLCILSISDLLLAPSSCNPLHPSYLGNSMSRSLCCDSLLNDGQALVPEALVVPRKELLAPQAKCRRDSDSAPPL